MIPRIIKSVHLFYEMGRGSGGITFLVKEQSFANFKCTLKNRYFLGMHFEIEQNKYTIIASYIPPRVDCDVVVDDLDLIFDVNLTVTKMCYGWGILMQE